MRRSIRVRPRSLFTLFLLGLFVFAVVEVRDMPLTSRIYPWAIGFPVLVLLTFQLVKELRPRASNTAQEDEVGAADLSFTAQEATPAARLKTLELFGWVYGFVLALWLFGYFLGLPLMVFAYLKRHGESWLVSLSLPFGVWVFLWRVFDELLHLPFPPGVVFDWLG